MRRTGDRKDTRAWKIIVYLTAIRTKVPLAAMRGNTALRQDGERQGGLQETGRGGDELLAMAALHLRGKNRAKIRWSILLWMKSNAGIYGKEQ